MELRSKAVDIGKNIIPDTLKSLRQEIRLRKAGQLLGLPTSFPVPLAGKSDFPIYIVGGGASVLDFDFSSEEATNGFKLAMGPTIFLDQKFHYITFETSDSLDYMGLVGDKVLEIVANTDTKFILRIPHILKQMQSQPPVFQKIPSRAHLMASIDLLGPAMMESQIKQYLSGYVSHSKPGLDPRFTMGRLIIRLIKLGYKDIRLVGVDLLTPEYFYDVSEEYSSVRASLPKTRNKVHSTANPERIWPATLFLEKLLQFQERYGFQITADKKSSVSQILPAFN